MEALQCPMCGTEMTVKGQGRLNVRQCPDGHGIFLSRADLSALIDAETDWHREGGGFHTAPLPRITPDMTVPPPPPPKAPAWVATLFA